MKITAFVKGTIMRYVAVAVLILASSLISVAQTTAYQDADSHSSLYLMNAKANLIYNVSASTFTIGYLHSPNTVMENSLSNQRRLKADYQHELDQLDPPPPNASQDQLNAIASSRLFLTKEIAALDSIISSLEKDGSGSSSRPMYGLSFSAKPSTDLGGQIFQASKSPASVTGGASIGIHGVRSVPPVLLAEDAKVGKTHSIQDDSLFVFSDFTRSTFDTVPTSSTTVTTQHFNGFDILPTYNAFLEHCGWDFLVGLSAGINRRNNSDSLKKVMMNTTDAQSGSVAVVTQKSAYMGEYSAAIGVPIYSDFVVIPPKTEWLSIDFFERANAAPKNGYGEGGVGVYIAKPSKPTEVLGGVSVAWKDGKSTIAVVAGWSF